ncbi:unnamed protein product [Peronospora destructor]|uniref:PH domain-containing protein n=1 Tax=Peronospora destructor TaxID=86335 RepID=A0AAV0TQI8_9STRA|nr:unnamed protein product [Peronospora destructor]
MQQPFRSLSSASTRTHSSSCRSRARSAASIDSTSSMTAEVTPISSSSTVTSISGSFENFDCVKDERLQSTAGQRFSTLPVKPALSDKCVDLAAYYTFSKKNSNVIYDDSHGLSGFLDYRKLNGTWRPFLFQTIGHQLVLYRVHSTHQVMVMSTDIRNAFQIALEYDGANGQENTRLLRLGINGTTIILRAVTHRAAIHWVDGLQRLRDGKPLQFVSDPSCSAESDEDIFVEIDKLFLQREWTPPPPSTPLCSLCISTEHLATGMLLKSKPKLNDGVSTGCKIC